MARRHTNHQMQGKVNNFGVKYGKQENINKANHISKMGKELEGLKVGLTAEIYIDSLRTTLRNIKLENARPWWHTWILVQEIHYHSWQTSTRNEHVSTRSKYTNGWPKERLHWSKKTSQRNHPKQLRTHNVPTIMWKILTAQIREGIYDSLISRGLFLDDQKGCFKGSRGTGDLLYINQHILNESKTRRKNLAMAWIDYKKVYDMVPQSCIINCLKMYKISDEVINYWENYENLESVIDNKLKQSVLGDALSPLLLVIAIMLLNHIFSGCTGGYKLSKLQEKINR